MIAIIDYNAGNITSVKNALDRLGYESTLTSRHEEIMSADIMIDIILFIICLCNVFFKYSTHDAKVV